MFYLREYTLLTFFAPVTLILTLYEFDPYSLEIHRMCKYQLPTQGFRKLSSDRHIYIHTDRTEIICHAASWVVKNIV